MKCAECDNEACYSVEEDYYSNGAYGARTTEWKHLCKKCYNKFKEAKE